MPCGTRRKTGTSLATPVNEQAATQDRSKCYFATIPPEMRNRIYEFFFFSNAAEWLDCPVHDIGADTIKALQPSHSLVLSNREVYYEAMGIYDDARRQFWAQMTLQIIFADPERAASAIAAMRDKDVAAVKSVRMMDAPTIPTLQRGYELSGGIWQEYQHDRQGYEMERWIMVPST